MSWEYKFFRCRGFFVFLIFVWYIFVFDKYLMKELMNCYYLVKVLFQEGSNI